MPSRDQTPKSARKGPGGARVGAGRPRRVTLSEKEELDKARSLGRRNMVKVMQGWIDDLDAMENVYYQGEVVDTVENTTARDEARRQIADRCGFRFDPNEQPSDIGRELLAIFARVPAPTMDPEK